MNDSMRKCIFGHGSTEKSQMSLHIHSVLSVFVGHFLDNQGSNVLQGPVVQSIVSLTNSTPTMLMTNSLIVLAKVFSNTLIFSLQKCE